MKKKVFVTLTAGIILFMSCHLITNTVKQHFTASNSICALPDPPDPEPDHFPPTGGGGK